MSDPAALARARMLINAGRHADGLHELGTVLAHHPDDPSALCLAARALLGTGERRKALDCAARAAALNPDDDWALRLVALANAHLGRAADALQAARRAIKAAPSSWLTHLQVAVVSRMTHNVTEATLDAVNEAVRLAPNEPDAHRMAGHINYELRHRKAAQAAFRRALELDPADAISRHELARLSLGRFRLAKAADGFGNAVELDPTLDVGVHNLDVVLARLLVRVYWMAWAAAFLQPLPGLHLVAPSLLTAGLILWGWLFWRRAGRRLRGYLSTRVRSQQDLAISLGCLAIAWCLLWVNALLPRQNFGLTLATLLFIATSGIVRKQWTLRLRRY